MAGSVGNSCRELIADEYRRLGGKVIKRSIAAFVLALMVVPFGATAASAAAQPDRLECLFYQTFRERELTDCL